MITIFVRSDDYWDFVFTDFGRTSEYSIVWFHFHLNMDAKFWLYAVSINCVMGQISNFIYKCIKLFFKLNYTNFIFFKYLTVISEFRLFLFFSRIWEPSLTLIRWSNSACWYFWFDLSHSGQSCWHTVFRVVLWCLIPTIFFMNFWHCNFAYSCALNHFTSLGIICGILKTHNIWYDFR